MGDQLSMEETLKDPRYTNWLKAVIILRELKVGISSFVEVRCREAQENVLQTVLNNLPPHVTAVPQCTTCTRDSLQGKNVHKVSCPQNVCPFVLQETNKFHKDKSINLPATCVRDLTDTSHSWEFAKTFIKGEGYGDNKSAADTDCTGLLSIIINCVWIHHSLTEDMRITRTVFHKVKEIRNKVMHSSDYLISDARLQDLIKACVQILAEPKILAADTTAIAAGELIKGIEGMLLTVSNVESVILEVKAYVKQELSVVTGKQASQGEDISDLTRQLNELKGHVGVLERYIEQLQTPDIDRMDQFDHNSKCCIHEARTLLKDGERQGYVLKGKIVKTYSLLKRKMKRDDTKYLALALELHRKITDYQMEEVEETLKCRDAVEKLLKHVLGGDSETHRCFVLECETRENVKDVCDTDLSEKEMDAFIGLEMMDDGKCRRPTGATNLTFKEQQKCLLMTALNYDLKSDVVNDTFLSRFCISVSEHTKVWNCEMGNEKRINKLIATMQECHHSVLTTLRESLISLNMTHIADRVEERTVSIDKSSDSSPSAILKQESFFQCSLCLAKIDCHLDSVSRGSVTFHLAADSNKWNKLKQNCSSGNIISLIEQLYQMLASNGALGIGIGKHRMDVTIYTITHLGTKEAEKAFLHLSTDGDTAVTGSDDGNYQPDVRFNPMLDHYDILVEVLDVTRRLLKSLVEKECLAYGDIEETLTIDSRSGQAEHLINKLIGHGQECFYVLQEHLRVTDKDVFNLLQERDINLKREKLYAGTVVLNVTHTSTPEGDKTTDKVMVTCINIINPTCHFQSKEETGHTLDTASHDNHAEEERLNDETTLEQNDKWKAALVKAYASLMNEMPTETAVCLTDLLLENKSISEDQSHIIKRCGFRRENVGNLLHCVLRGDQQTWAVFKSGLGIIPKDITATEQQEFLRLENLSFENGKRMHHQEPRLRLKECDVVTLTCNFLSNFTAIDKLNDGLLSKFHFSRQEHEAILNCDRDILYRADLLISTMEQCSENIISDFLSLLEDVGLDDVVGQLKHHAAKKRHEKGPVQQEDMDTGSTFLKRKLSSLRQYLLRKLGFYLDHTTGLGRIELVPRDSEAWTNLEKSGEIENLVPLLYDNLPTHPLLQSSENRVLSLKIYIHDNHCRSRKFVSGRTAVLDLSETTDEDTTTSSHGLLIDERHNPIKMHEELLLEGIEIPSLLGDFKEEGMFGHLPDIEAAGIRSRSKEMRRFLRRLSPTGRKLYNVLLLNVKKNDPAIFHELGAREILATDSREYFTAEVQAPVIMQGDLERRTLQVNNPTFHFKLQEESVEVQSIASVTNDGNGDEHMEEESVEVQSIASVTNDGNGDEHMEEESVEVQSIAPVTYDGNEDQHMEGMCPDLGCWRVKLIKTYALLKEEMTKSSTKAVADLLYQQDRLDISKLQSISDSTWRRGMVEELLKWVLIGEKETFEEFMKGLRDRDEEMLADTIEAVTICTDETEAFKDLELFSLKRRERPINHDERFNLTKKAVGTLTYYLYDKNHIDLLNDKFLSGFHFSVSEHTNICQFGLCGEERVNTLLDTVKLCSETVYPILCEGLHKATLGHVVKKLECYRQTAKKRKSSQDLATEPSTSTDAKRKRVDSSIECRLVTFMQKSISTLRLHIMDQIAFYVDHINNCSSVIQLSPTSTESWKKLEESCESGNIKDLIQFVYSNESIQDLLPEGEYHLQFTIYTIPSDESPVDQASSGKKALFHLETDQSSATPPTTATTEPGVPASNPIEDHMDLLVEELEITPGLLEALQDEGMVGSTIKEDVKKAGFRTKKIKYLLEKLSSSGEKGYQALLISLGKGNEDLKKELNTRGSHISIYDKQTFFTGTVVLKVTHSTALVSGKKDNVDPSDSQTELRITCPEIINPVCHFRARGMDTVAREPDAGAVTMMLEEVWEREGTSKSPQDREVQPLKKQTSDVDHPEKQDTQRDYDSSKYCIHEARTLIKDGERQGYVLKGKIVKTYSLLKQKMKRGDTTYLASALVLHGKIMHDQMEEVEETLKYRDAVEKLLKHVLRGDSETHRCFVLECETRENVKDVCDTDLSEEEMDAFIGLEMMDEGRCRRPTGATKLTFKEQQKCLLITALNDDLKSDVVNDTLLSRFCISISEHTKVWKCEMGNEKRINTLIATMQECHHSVLTTLRESLISLNMTHIADIFEGCTVSIDQSSDSSPSAILKQEKFQCSLCLAQIDCRLNSISTGSITFHLATDSNKWNKLKEDCRSGTIGRLIQQLYQILASNGALEIGEYRMDVTIYTITHLGTNEAEKAFLHLSTDGDPAATGLDDGDYQLDVRFNPMLDHYDILVEVLDVTRRLLKSLVENECLAYGDIEETLAIDSRSDQAEHLINKLIGHGQICFNVLQEHLRVTDKDMFNFLQERDINLKREKFYAGTFVLHVTHTCSPEGDTTTDKVMVTCIDIINPTCHFQSKEETGQTLDTASHDNHAEEERLKDETTLDQDDKWKAALVKAYASLMNEMPTETAVYLTNLLLEHKSINEDQSHIIKRCGFRRETVGNLLHCVLRGDQKTWAVFKSGLGSIPEDITITEQQEFLRLENLSFENGKRMHHQEPRLRLKECDVVTLTCNFLSNFTAIDKLNDGLLSKFHFSRQEHEAILNCDRDILYRADLLISTMEQCSENIVGDFLSLLEDVGLDGVVGQLKHHAAKKRHEKGPVQQKDMDTGSAALKRKLPALRQYLLRKLGFYLDHTTGLGRIELVPRDSEAWTNLEKSGEIENLVPLLYDNLPTHPLLQSSENRVLSLKIYIHDNHCRSRNFVSGRTAVLDLSETTDEDTTTSSHGLLIDERHNPIKMHEELLLEGIEIPSLLGDLKEEGVFGHLPDIEAAGIRSRSKEMRRFLRRLSPTGRKLYNVLLLNVKQNDPAIFHELGAREKLATESREYFTAEVQAPVIMQGDLERRTLQVNNPTFHFKLQDKEWREI